MKLASIRLVGIVAVLALVVMTGWSTAAATDDLVLKEPVRVRVGYQPGTQDLVMTYMLEQGFADKYNLDLDVVTMLNPPALHTALVEKQLDIGFAGYVTAAIARHQGKDTMIFGLLTGPSNLILAPKDSPIETLADLRGKKVGVFGGPGSTTTQLFMAVAHAVYGVDLARETELVTAPNPALFGLLDRGDLAAALFGTTDSLRGLLTDKYKIISDIAEDWEKLYGRPPAHVTMASNDEYAARHPEVLTAFMAAYYDTLDYIRSRPDIWEDYARRIELNDPRAPELLETRVGSRFVSVFDQQQYDAQIQLLETLMEVMGTETLFPEIPEGLMRLDLQPQNR